MCDRRTNQKASKLQVRGFMHESDAKADSTGAAFVLHVFYVASHFFCLIRATAQTEKLGNVNMSKDRRIKPFTS